METLGKASNGLMDKSETLNIVLFSLGKLVSLFGTSLYTFAMGLYVLRLTGSGLSFAATLVLAMVPMVMVNPLAGVLADRLNRKALAVMMDLLNGMLLIGLYFLSWTYGLSIMMIYSCTFMMNVLTTIFNISMESAKPNMVFENNLLKINSISKIIDSTSAISGPMVGGLVFAFVDIKAFILLNGISFMLSGLSEVFIDFSLCSEEKAENGKKMNLMKDIKEGFHYMAGNKQVMDLFIILIFLNFFISLSISVPLPYIINNILKLNARYFGIIQGSFPLGMILGAIFVKKLWDRFCYSQLLLKLNFIISICMIMMALPLWGFEYNFRAIIYLMYYSFVMILLGIVISFIDIPIIFILQKIIPDEYRGRVLSLGMSLVKIIAPLGLILSGFLVNVLPPYFLPSAGGMFLCIFTILFIKVRGERG